MPGRSRKTLVGLTAVLLMAGATLTPPSVLSGARARRPARRGGDITATVLKDYLTFISSDEMEGRDTPSRGLDITARFLAVQLARAGAEPAGDNGTYFQRIGLTTRKVDPDKTTATLTHEAAAPRRTRSRGASPTATTFWPRRYRASPKAT